MPNPIKPKRSHTSSAQPTVADLAVNELAVNWTDGKLFTRSPSDAIVSWTLGGSGGGSYTLPTATASVLGGVKVGTGLTITDGVLAASGGSGSLSGSVTIPASGDQYWADTVLLLKGDGSLTDSSSFARTVTAYGNAAATGTAQYGSNSVAFDGDGDTLETPALGLAGNDFTIEMWLQLLGTPSSQVIVTTYNTSTQLGTFILGRTSSNEVKFQDPYGTSVTSAALTNGQWYHIAAVYAHATTKYKLFVDGVSAGEVTASAVSTQATNFHIGGSRNDNNIGSQWLNGRIDDLRVSKTASRYPANFTPPAALQTGTYTAEQTLQVTFTGGGGSGFSWSTVPASATASGAAGDVAYDGNYIYVATGASAWKRAALSTWAPPDPSFSAVSLLMHGDGNLTDSSSYAKTVTAYGNAAASAPARWGTNSISFDGSQGYLSTPTDTSLDLGTAWTIECWVYSTSSSGNQGILLKGLYSVPAGSRWTDFAMSIRYFPGYGIRFYFTGETGGSSGEQFIDVLESLPLNQWCHIASVRNGSSGACYIDGVQKGTIANLNSQPASTSPLEIGRWLYSTPQGNAAEYFAGRIDDLRITKAARYPVSSGASFAPPTAAFPDA